MFFSPAFAQAGESAATNPLIQLAPLIFIFVIFYFLLIRPQQQARKKHQEMVANVRRGDVVAAIEPDLRTRCHMGLQGAVCEVLEPGRPARRLEAG